MTRDELNRRVSEVRDRWFYAIGDGSHFGPWNPELEKYAVAVDWYSPANAMVLLAEMLDAGLAIQFVPQQAGGLVLWLNYEHDCKGKGVVDAIVAAWLRWKGV